MASIQYFYPALDRQRLHEMPEADRLGVYVATVSSHDVSVSTLEELFAALESRRL